MRSTRLSIEWALDGTGGRRVPGRENLNATWESGGNPPRPRPARRHPRQHFLDQAPGLRVHVLVSIRRRAQDELAGIVLDVAGDALDDRVGIAEGEVRGCIAT